jgi:hypothetical protein
MSTYQNYLQVYTRGYIGYSTLNVMIQSCLGGITAMLILMHGNGLAQMIQLFVTVLLCVGYNGAVLSQMPAKFSFNLFIASIVVNTIVLVTNCFY